MGDSERDPAAGYQTGGNGKAMANALPNTIYEKPKVIAVDVDGTLHENGYCNDRLVKWMRAKKADGYFIIIWSMRGLSHAKKAAERFGVADIADAIIPKPGYIVDDNGWAWTRYSSVVRTFLKVDANEPTT